MNSTSIKFFFFGCWNNEQNNNGAPRNAVIQSLIGRNDLQFGIVAGDNVYPFKTETNTGKTKDYKVSTISNGFNRLNGLQKPIDMIIGNHNVDRSQLLNLEIIASSPNISLFATNDIFSFGMANFVMLNTNDVDNVVTFLQELVNNKTILENKWNIVVGHHPLFAIRQKKNKVKESILDRVFEIAYLLHKIPNVIYMCADVHDFQAGFLNFNREVLIPMVVSGTGGAEPEEAPLKGNKYSLQEDTMSVTYDISLKDIPYGYCEVEVSTDKLAVTYNKVYPGPGYSLQRFELEKSQTRGGRGKRNKKSA